MNNEFYTEFEISKIINRSVFDVRYWRRSNQGPAFDRVKQAGMETFRVQYPKLKFLNWFRTHNQEKVFK